MKSQGWKIYRLWSTDWFRDRDKSLQGILKAIELAQKSPTEAFVQAAPTREIVDEQSSQADKPEDFAETPEPIPAMKKKYAAGKPYQKFSVERKRNSKVLMNKARYPELADVVAGIIEAESPIHQDLIVERLKKVYGVSKAGANIHKNVVHAAKVAAGRYGYKGRSRFMYKNDSRPDRFRVSPPCEGCLLSHIAPKKLKTQFFIPWKIILVLPENKLPKLFWKFSDWAGPHGTNGND